MKSMGTQILRDVAVLCEVPCPDTAQNTEIGMPDMPWGSEKMYTNMTDMQLIAAILKHDTTGVVTAAALELVEANALRARIAQAPRKQVVQLFTVHEIKFEPGMPRREMAKLPTWEQLQQMLVSELSDGDVSDDEPAVYIKLKPAPAEKIEEPLAAKPEKEKRKLADAVTQLKEAASSKSGASATVTEGTAQPTPAGGDEADDDDAAVDGAATKKRKREMDSDGETEGQMSADPQTVNGDDCGVGVTPTPMVAAPAAAPAAATASAAAAAPLGAAVAAPAAAPAPAATAAPTAATPVLTADSATSPSTGTAGSKASSTEKADVPTAQHSSDGAGAAADVKVSDGTSGNSAAGAPDAVHSTAQQSSEDEDIDEKDVPLPDPLPPPPSDVQLEMAKAYLKQVGLDAWYEHFADQIPHTLKSVESLRCTTQSDLVTMAKGSNMMLDAATIDQVLNCLKMQPIDEIVNAAWNKWARKKAVEQRKAFKKARLKREAIAAQQAAKEAAVDLKQKKKEDRKRSKPDPSLPKKPKGRLSAYMYFTKSIRPEVLKEHPELEKNVTAQGKHMGQMWRQLSEQQKEPYTKLAAEDAAREQKELEGYREEVLKARKADPNSSTEQKHGAEKATTEAKVANDPKANIASNEAQMAKPAKGVATSAAALSSTKPPPKKRVRQENGEKKTGTKSKSGPPESATSQKKKAATAAAAASKKGPDPLEVEFRRVLRHSAWPAEETAVLQKLVALQGEGRWTLKAHLLGTGRSPGQVKQHWIYLQAGKIKAPAGQNGLSPSPEVEESNRLLQIHKEQTLAREAAAEAAGEIRDLADNYNPLEGGGNPLPNELTEWGYYDSLEELDSLLCFLEPRGYKERRLLIRMRRILPLLAGAMAIGRQVRCETKGVGTIMGVDTDEFDSSTADGSADCDVAAGVAPTDVRGLRLSIRYLDHSTALISMADARARLLPIDADAAARAIASPLQDQARRSAANAAAKDAAAAIHSASTLAHLTTRQRPGLIPCHPADVCVARENAVCAKTGKKIVAWVDLIAWARETTPNPLKPNAPGEYSTFLVCLAANRSDPWPEPDLKAKLGKRNKAKVDRDDEEGTGRAAAKGSPIRPRTEQHASPDAASKAAAKAYELAQKAVCSRHPGSLTLSLTMPACLPASLPPCVSVCLSHTLSHSCLSDRGGRGRAGEEAKGRREEKGTGEPPGS